MEAVSSSASLFCDHRRLRTTCPECRPPPPPPKPPAAKKPTKEKTEGITRRRRVKAPTREEAEQAEAWWVRG